MMRIQTSGKDQWHRDDSRKILLLLIGGLFWVPLAKSREGLVLIQTRRSV